MPTKIYISKADITDMAVEAIVNPVNTDLAMGSGVAGAIRRKGGERIRKSANASPPSAWAPPQLRRAATSGRSM